jgi:DNA-binding CsgD family transcriptional regulator
MLSRRYGASGDFEAESALVNMSAVPDPRVRTSFTYLLSYDVFLRGDYSNARTISESTVEQALKYQLSWAVPHAEWVLAAAHLGLREFAQSERRLRRVQQAADALDDPHLGLNAAVLRARLLLALGQPHQAHELLRLDDSRAVNPAMRGELIAMRGLALAVLGDGRRAASFAREAEATTAALEVLAFVACVRGIVRPDEAHRAYELADRLDVWDPFICTIRAHPPFLQAVAQQTERLAHLQTLLRRSNDFDLADEANIPIGRRPRAQRGGLSRREHEVMQLVSQGLTDKQIGRILFISPGTAKVHVHHALEKLNARTRAEAAAKYSFDSETFRSD